VTPTGATAADRAERLRRLERDNATRLATATAGLQRVLTEAAVADSRLGYSGAELSRIGPEQAARAYQQLAEVGVRYIARATHLALAHRDDYVLGLLAPGRVLATAPPPVLPAAAGYDPVRWAGWYQLLAAWVAEQQTRSAMLYRALADEVAAGRLAQSAVQSSAQAFAETRLQGYLRELAGLNAELVSEILDVADACLDALTAAIAGGPADSRVVLDVDGPATATVTAELLIENAHNEAASVSCLATPAAGFGLTAAPITMRLERGESQPLAVQVILPPVPSPGPVSAGRIIIRGHGETDLVAEVRAQVGHPVMSASEESFTDLTH
jgi:hypothetical protein